MKSFSFKNRVKKSGWIEFWASRENICRTTTWCQSCIKDLLLFNVSALFGFSTTNFWSLLSFVCCLYTLSFFTSTCIRKWTIFYFRWIEKSEHSTFCMSILIMAIIQAAARFTTNIKEHFLVVPVEWDHKLMLQVKWDRRLMISRQRESKKGERLLTLRCSQISKMSMSMSGSQTSQCQGLEVKMVIFKS